MACARVAVGAASTSDLERAARATVDWPTVIQQSIDHRLSALLYKQVLSLDPSLCPADAKDTLQSLYRSSVQRGLFMSSRLCRVLDLLSAAGITALPYKGPVLSVQAFGDPGLRAPADLDVLVPHEQVPLATEALLREGFTRRGGWPPEHDASHLAQGGELAFDSPALDCLLEVHERVGTLLKATSIPADHLIERSTRLTYLTGRWPLRAWTTRCSCSACTAQGTSGTGLN